MSAVREGLPDGRYGRSADERADRKLKIVGSVLGAGLLALVGWFGYDYIAGQRISAEVIKFDVSAADRVQVHLEVRKDAAAKGSCTLRALAEDGSEVGHKDVRFDRAEERIDQVVTVRVTTKATSAELLGCTAD
ncbi:DUF4307 domain-containing protein [Streptomyces sp. WAC05374]|uniref:DUF4307 domain-containing protein n=1 Tax=unclassified Streptomyces TaxID=2593676 RepID=UPI000F883679|nr:DUF4307 domain-containing protein [Streptomyces sp. WAC05374]RST18826.1 DUF4307 domain-containing protein [Streptomyces sp. WAC05374]TDF43202.1 DUF4307 domain-containing protein [Streptomyces sp. WAC05374]TDF50988.1 DUF4307 domain-containing protein [Streptomyces sp. WAC05374]TDF52269.1 DUF4307 domain-containing protein [Streptomyces sp. WAC05374]